MAPSSSVISSIFNSRAPTVKGLQNVLQQIGCATSGKKDVLHSRIAQAINHPPPIDSRKEAKILSIDMGIKNLAYCVAKVRSSSPEAQGHATMNVLAWRRLDLTEAGKHDNKNENENQIQEAEEEQDLFSPKNLSSTAFSLVRELLKHEPDVILIERQRWRSASSSAIQQWTVRVNSLEAMLWAIFTVFRGMSSLHRSPKSSEKRKEFTVHSIDPKRVGNYWIDTMQINPTPSPPLAKPTKKRSKKTSNTPEDPDIHSDLTPVTTTKPLPRTKAEKKAKIQILRTWLNSPTPSTAPTHPKTTTTSPLLPHPTIHFTFTRKPRQQTTPPPLNEEEEEEEDPITALNALLRTTTTPPPTAKAKKADGPPGKSRKVNEGKVDDIADCFLQAAAFVAWQEGLGVLRRAVGEGVEVEVGEGEGREKGKGRGRMGRRGSRGE